MISKNLKIGDTFSDDGREYEIIGLHELGYYISKLKGKKVEKPIEKPVEKPVEKEEEKYTKTQINRMPLTELEALAKELGIEVGSGTEMKKAIIEKLEL